MTKGYEEQMKKGLFLSFLFIFLGFNFSCQSAVSPGAIGRKLFDSLKTNSNSNIDNFSSLFLKSEDGNALYRELLTKAPKRGVNDWNKIEYVDYIHKEFIKKGIKYSSGCLVIKLNGDSDYYYLGIFLLNIQVGNEYKILESNDNWSRNSTAPSKEDLLEALDDIEESWVN